VSVGTIVPNKPFSSSNGRAMILEFSAADRRRFVRVDAAIAKVPNEEIAGVFPEAAWCHGNAPWRIQ
jgi:hypothetical protein